MSNLKEEYPVGIKNNKLEREAKQATNRILNPSELLQKYSPYQIGVLLKGVLEDTYQGRTYNPEGYKAETFAKEISDKTLEVFLAFDSKLDEPIASYAIEYQGITANMVYAAVVPRARGEFSGQKLYGLGKKWVEEKHPEIFITYSGATLPESAYIAAKSGRFLSAFLPQSLINDGTGSVQREFIALTEGYPYGHAFSPQKVYLPDDPVTSRRIKTMWDAFAMYNHQKNIEYTTEAVLARTPYTVTIEGSNYERTKAVIQATQEKGMSLQESDSLFNKVVDFIRMTVDPTSPQSATLQTLVLEQGYKFAGIIPRIEPIDTIYGKFSRPPRNMFVKVKEDIVVVAHCTPDLKRLNLEWITSGFIETMGALCTRA